MTIMNTSTGTDNAASLLKAVDIENGTQGSNSASTKQEDQDHLYVKCMREIHSKQDLLLEPMFPFFYEVSLRLDYLAWGKAYILEEEDNKRKGLEPPALPRQAKMDGFLTDAIIMLITIMLILSTIYGILDCLDFHALTTATLCEEPATLPFKIFGYFLLPAFKGWAFGLLCIATSTPRMDEHATINTKVIFSIFAAIGAYSFDLGYSDGGALCLLSNSNVKKRALIHLMAGFSGTVWADAYINVDALLRGTQFTQGQWCCFQAVQFCILYIFLGPVLPPFILGMCFSMPFTTRIRSTSEQESKLQVLSALDASCHPTFHWYYSGVLLFCFVWIKQAEMLCDYTGYSWLYS